MKQKRHTAEDAARADMLRRRLRLLLHTRNMNPMQVANRGGFHQNCLYNFLSGRSQRLDCLTWVKVARVLEVPFEMLWADL